MTPGAVLYLELDLYISQTCFFFFSLMFEPHPLQNATQTAVKVQPSATESAPAQPGFVFSKTPRF